jgi:hypothetical protein
MISGVPSLEAQLTSGSVVGSVRDISGGVIPGATVTLVSATKGTTIETTTNENGDFTFPNALGDTYTVRVTMDGFKTIERPNIPLSPGDRVVVPTLTIEVGGHSEIITVSGETPMVQSRSGERSFTVTSEAVSNLPIASRSFADLALMAPGMVVGNSTASGGAGVFRLGGGGGNNVMQDGVVTQETGGTSPGGSFPMNNDAIAEVRVLSQGYQAEYGRASGVQISAVSKSGTNQFKGSTYDIERNSAWNDNSWVNRMNGDPKAVLRERDWGYTLGGPVGKPGGVNKLFFFFAHELRPRTTGGTITRFTVPTALERTGDFSQSVENNGNLFNLIRDASSGMPCTATDTRGCFRDGDVVGRIPADRQYVTGLNILKLWPLPNAKGTGYNYEATAPEDKRLTQQLQLRLDYQVSNRLRVMGKLATQRATSKVTPGSIPGFNDTLQKYPYLTHGVTTVNYTLGRSVFLEATYGGLQSAGGGTGPIVTPQANRFNSGIGDIPFIYPEAQTVDPRYFAYGYLQGVNPPSFQDGQMLLMPTFQWGPRIANPPPSLSFPGFINGYREQQVSISVTKLAGSHTTKAGFYLFHSYKAQTQGNFWGTINFGNDTNNPIDSGFGFANAALGGFSSYSQQSKMLEGNYVYNNVEGYIQDNWKVTPKLTLDYGLRLTHQQPQYDSYGQASNFFADKWDASQAPLLYLAGCPGNANPCAANRQAMDPRTGQLLGQNTALTIGAVVPNTGDAMNGIIRNGDGIARENYTWPTLVLGPRFGAAYDVRGDSTVVVRGALGLLYDRPEGNSVFNAISNPPYSTSSTVRYGQLQSLNNSNARQTPPAMFTFKYDAKIPASFQWNVGAQIALPWASVLDVSYVGQRGINLLRTPAASINQDMNAVDFGAAYLQSNQDPTLAASAVPGATALSTDLLRPYRGLGAINIQWPRNYELYHSIQTSLNRRFRNGLQLGLNYTLGLSYTGTTLTPLRLQHVADGSFSFRDDQAEQDELLKDMGLQRHTLKANFVWDLPDIERTGRMRKVVASLVNDWRLSGILTAGSAVPYDIAYSYQTAGANVNLTGSPSYGARVRIVGDPGSGCSNNQYGQINPAAFAGPNYGSLGLESGRFVMSGCPDHTVDLAIARNFPIKHGRNIQLRADVFNAFNAVIYNARVTQLQLRSPTEQVLLNAQYNSDGTVNATRLQPRNAGFGAATGAQAMRSVQLQLRFQF